MNADVSDDLDDDEGFMDFDNPDNPFAGYTVVFVPYCTGDVFLGNATHEYAPDLTVEHKGYVNGTTALQYLADTYPGAEHVAVIGESAGAVAAPLYGGLMADALPDAQVTVFADGAGGYPDVPGLNGLLGGLWGTQNAVPDWPENEGMTAERWSFPGLWVQAGTHAPDVVMSRFDYAFDETQVFYAGLSGYDASGLVDLMDANEARVEGEGVEPLSYTAPGDDHTLVRKDEFYEMEVDGVLLVDWLDDVLAGDDVDDIHCTECEPPATVESSIPATSTA